MPDYGHKLTFGTFLTPQNQQPHLVVSLAKLTETAGLDLATFQDHPYQSRFLDTWTLMTYVAAQTEKISIAPNVINLPLRPPAVLARSAASLDLLSNGRFELGLGAGAFWDAIEAMGGRRLAPGEAVEALAEALDIIRGVWDTSERRGLRLSGKWYQVDGMARGPAPAHDVGIWLGAYKPRMLRLTGARADGWLPSLGYMTLDHLAEGNAIIDESALAAGRTPQDVRRLLNINGIFASTSQGFLAGPPEQWVEELAALALEYGISTFILSGDDPDNIEVFGEEVAPAVRELVAKARGGSGPDDPSGPEESPRISPSVESTPGGSSRRETRRSEKIDYAAIPASLQAHAIAPGDRGYDAARSTYMQEGHPGLVLMASTPGEVADGIAYARQQDVPLSVRSAGHGVHGLSTNDGGIILDVSRMNEITILDESRKLVRVGPGATWGHIAERLAEYGWAMSSGDYGDVGVGGLATAGGIGWMVRKYGLTIDHITAAEIVLADGQLVRTDAVHHPDLFWGVRGAGANLGIVTAVEFEAYDVGNVIFSYMALDASDTASLVGQWGAYMEHAPRELTSFMNLTPARRGQSQPVAQMLSVFASDDIPAAQAALEPMLQWAPVLDQQAQILPYRALVAPHDTPHSGQARISTRTGLLDRMTPAVAARIGELLQSRSVFLVQLRSLGGAVNDISPHEMAYPHRTQQIFVNSLAADFQADKLAASWEPMTPYVTGLYLNFATDTGIERVKEAYPSPVFERLQRLKQEYDPENVFNRNMNIPPVSQPVLQRAAS